MAEVERQDWCGCRTRFVPPKPCVEGEPYEEEPLVVTAFSPCRRHRDWIEALAESHAHSCGRRRLVAAGLEHIRSFHDGERLIFETSFPFDETVRAMLNATEADQDWRSPCVPPEEIERFQSRVVDSLLTGRLVSR